MEKPGIAVELRDRAVGKRGFAVVRRVSEVGWDLKTVGLQRSAVGAGDFAMETGRSAVERNGVAVGKAAFYMVDVIPATGNEAGSKPLMLERRWR